MPSVLVELGYISNRQEEQFMRTAAGQNKLAEALYDAFANIRRITIVVKEIFPELSLLP